MSEISIAAAHTFLPARFVLRATVLLALLAYCAAGLYVIEPEQTGMVNRLGAILPEEVPPGIHYHWPWPIERVVRINTREVRSIQQNFDKTSGYETAAEGCALLTGDENLVLLNLQIHYTIIGPKDYLRAAEDPERMLTRLVQSTTTRRMASWGIEDALTTGRNQIQHSLETDVQRQADALKLGLRIVSIQIRSIDPPETVAHSFKDVASAREDAHKLVQKANGERNRRLPEARAKAGRQRMEADADANEAMQRAHGDARRFISTWEAYRHAKDVSAYRMYVETMERILSRVKKQLIDPRAERGAAFTDPTR